MKKTILAAVALIAATSQAPAQQACPCVPLSHVWTVEVCEKWNCAASAAIMANGDPYVLALPAGTNDGRWLILKRITAGAAFVPSPDGPFAVESFDGVDAAVARFSSLTGDRVPMMLSVPDGKFVVIMLREPAAMKRRAAGK